MEFIRAKPFKNKLDYLSHLILKFLLLVSTQVKIFANINLSKSEKYLGL